eukprot:883839-Prymnesium_polylepis.1
MVTADDVLREYRREQGGGCAHAGRGRRLQDGPSALAAAPPGVAADIAWMEARVAQLEVEAAAVPAVPRHGRRSSNPPAAAAPSTSSAASSRRSSSASVGGLAQLEAAAAASAQQVRSEQRRIAALRQ